MSRFDECLPLILAYEGGFVDDPTDLGGRTNKGITQRTYDAWLAKHGQTPRDVKNIPDADVAAIYKAEYWDVCGASQLKPPLDLFHFDASVNHGPGRAAAFLKVSNGDPSAYLVAREQFYRGIVARKPEQVKFLNGWLRRLDKLRSYLS